MSRIEIPFSDYAKIRTGPEMRAAVDAETAEIAAEANASAGLDDGYRTDSVVFNDRVRGHVRAHTYEAKRVEAKSSPLMQAAARRGAQ